VEVRAGGPEDRPAVASFLSGMRSLRVARRGELVDVLDHPAVVAWSGARVAGVATYVLEGERCELLTLHAATRRQGVGTALVEVVVETARSAGCRTLWLVTTNDNVDALRFYQRRGFRLAALRAGAVDASRERLKPEIPELGDHGIPLRDELELERDLRRP
jgi:ribosomal protein S18 acetylase RimI-like enzyme